MQARQGRSPAERAGVTGRAAHRARLFIDGEVVHREPTVNPPGTGACSGLG